MLNSCVGFHSKFPSTTEVIAQENYNLSEDFFVSQSVISMSAGTGNVSTLDISLGSISGDPAGISSITMSGNNAGELTVSSLPINSADLSSVTLTLTFVPVLVRDNTISVIINFTDGSTFTVYLYTSCFESNILSVPTTLNFGSVTVGSQSVLSLTITNISNYTPILLYNYLSSVTSITEYLVSGMETSISLLPGNSITLDVTFTPLDNSLRLASLVFMANNETHIVSLSGTGMDAQGVSTEVITIVQPNVIISSILQPTSALYYLTFSNYAASPFVITSYVCGDVSKLLFPDNIVGSVIAGGSDIGVASTSYNVPLSLSGSYI